MAYFLNEMQLLCRLIAHSSNPTYRKDKSHTLFRLNPSQASSLCALIDSIRQEKVDDIVQKLVMTLDRLYFPADTSRAAFDSFTSPIAVYAALKSVGPSGAYRQIWEIPPEVAAMQFSIRLHAFHYLCLDLQEWVRKLEVQEQRPLPGRHKAEKIEEAKSPASRLRPRKVASASDDLFSSDGESDNNDSNNSSASGKPSEPPSDVEYSSVYSSSMGDEFILKARLDSLDIKVDTVENMGEKDGEDWFK